MPEKVSMITLTTDFGLKDPFVGIMKGVICSIHPTARIVDITHDIERHSVAEACYALSYAHGYFPADTIHVVVVDPGVGTERRPLLVQNEKYFFLAPDNGVLSFLFGEESGCTVREIESDHYFRKPVSQTFHGRDIFAPVAAWIARGVRPEHVGSVISDYARLDLGRSVVSEKGIQGQIIHVDRFGNLLTNIHRRDLEAIGPEGQSFLARVGGLEIRGLYSSYAENTTAEPGLILSSFDLLEIFCYKGNAQEKTGLTVGAGVEVVLKIS